MTHYQDYGDPPSTSNTTDWEYVGFLAGSEDSPGSRPGELKTQTSNRYSLQNFFTNPPTVKDEGPLCARYINGTEANFNIEYPQLESDQYILKTTGHDPQTDYDPGSITYTISAGIDAGPVSAGASKAYYEGPILDEDPYGGPSWTFDYGATGSEVPTGQEDSVGVMFDFDAQSTESYVNIKLTQEYMFENVKQCDGTPTTIYSSTGSIDLYDDISII